MDNQKIIQALGVVATIGTLGLTLLGNWVGKKQENERIEKAVNKYMADKK